MKPVTWFSFCFEFSKADILRLPHTKILRTSCLTLRWESNKDFSTSSNTELQVPIQSFLWSKSRISCVFSDSKYTLCVYSDQLRGWNYADFLCVFTNWEAPSTSIPCVFRQVERIMYFLGFPKVQVMYFLCLPTSWEVQDGSVVFR